MQASPFAYGFRRLIACKFAPAQDLGEFQRKSARTATGREYQMQVGEQLGGVDGKFDKQIVAKELLGGGNEAARHDPPLRSQLVEYGPFLNLVDDAIFR